MSDGVEPRSRVNSNHKNVKYFIFVTMSSSLIQCLDTASFNVRFKPSQRMEVCVDRLIVVRGVALNSHKVGVSELNVAEEANCFAICRTQIISSYHLHTSGI